MCDDAALLPYRFYSLIIGSARTWWAGDTLGNVLAVPVGLGFRVLDVAGIRDFIEKEERAQAPAARRRRRTPVRS